MQIAASDITFVFQGGLSADLNLRYVADYTRDIFPGATLLLATQETELKKLNSRHGFDGVVATPDPGGLPSVKFDGAPHNVNRQLGSALAGLNAVTTPFAIKIRTDAYLASRKVVDYWTAWQDAPPGPTSVGRDRILCVSFFTVNPRYDERIPYHLSDWFQFGRTEDLLRYWGCPPYDHTMATWYERRPYHPDSLPREREFRSLYSTEQWFAMHYLSQADELPVDYHNHCTPEIVDEFETALVDNFIVVHPLDIDMFMPKHRWVFKSTYFNALCYSYPDWAKVMREKRGHVRGLDGYSQWPRTAAEKSLYMGVRTGRWSPILKRVPGPIGRSMHKRFFAWD